MSRKVYVHNDTGVDLWANLMIDDSRLHFVFMAWDEMPEHKQKNSDLLENAMIGDWDIPTDFSTVTQDGRPAINIKFSAGISLTARIAPAGLNGHTLIVLSQNAN